MARADGGWRCVSAIIPLDVLAKDRGLIPRGALPPMLLRPTSLPSSKSRGTSSGEEDEV